MRKRTWDIIAKYVSEEYGIKVVIGDYQGPQISLETKTIMLPEKIKEQNALAALSSLIHEAGHMKHSTIIPKDLATTNIDHYILNAMEDVRIDNLNYYILPNVYDFYEKFIREHVCSKKNKAEVIKQHMVVRCMIQLILSHTGFNKYCWDKEALVFINNNNLVNPFRMGSNSIDYRNWDEVKRCIKDIKSKFKFNEKPKEGGGGGQGEKGEQSGRSETNKDGCKGGGSGAGSGQRSDAQGDDGDPGDGKPKGNDTGSGVDKYDKAPEIKDPEQFLNPSSVWGKGQGLRGPGGLEFNPIELTQNTRRKFVDTLNIKEKYKENDGQRLNTDSLVSFFTGDVEELFIEDEIEKVKRSKIVFCLDASGSMSSRLFDRKSRKVTLANTVQALTSLLDEIRETEGLNVEYDIIAFTEFGNKLEKATWRQDYMRLSGGTSIWSAMNQAIKILNDTEIDGNRMVVLVTDGEVSSCEIDAVKDLIMKNNGEIKAMLLGIGASKQFVNLCGDNNILFTEHAEQILMEAIQTMLEE